MRKKYHHKAHKSPAGSWFTILWLIIAIILVIVTGVLAALTAGNMIKSPHYHQIVPLETAYKDAVIAAVLSLGSTGILFIGIIIYLVLRYQAEQKENPKATPTPQKKK